MGTSDSKDTRLYGRNGGQVVSVLAFNSGDRSLNPAEVYSLVQYFLFLLNINKILQPLNVKQIHLVRVTGIQTHDLLGMCPITTIPCSVDIRIPFTL